VFGSSIQHFACHETYLFFAYAANSAHNSLRSIRWLIDMEHMDKITDGRTLAHAMVDTVRESLLVLDGNLSVVAASRSFYATFQTTPEETIGRMVYDLGTGAWNNPALRLLLDRIVPEHGVMDNFEIEQLFPVIGQKTMLLNARKVFYEGDANTTLLLAIEDITDRRIAERQLHVLSEQKDMLLSEMGHRVANSLQIVASILMLKARSVLSDETRGHLEDAHRRVMSVASLQQHLKASGIGEHVDVGAYLVTLCETLTGSMIGESSRVTMKVVADTGTVPSEQAVSLGLIVTELVINALKYAFPDVSKSGRVTVTYEMNNGSWKLAVADNGGGIKERPQRKLSGLGTTLVKALAQQLDGEVETISSANGTTISVKHSAVQAALPTAAE
jgi:two-component sensor histidine kinase